MADKKRVLITGGAGLIGSILREHLSDRFELTSLDRVEVPGAKSFAGDISEFDQIRPAFEGQDAVVHLAADPNARGEWDTNLKNNFIGTYNVFEAARQAGVKRVVFASSNHATGGYYLDAPWKHIVAGEFDKVERPYTLVDESMRIRPDGYYGTAKAYGEALGSYYLDYHGVQSIHLRIGWVMRGNDPTFAPFALALWLSYRDAAQIVQKAVDAPATLPYAIVYATSDNRWKIFSLDNARKLLGYQPQDGAGEKWTPRPAPARR